MEISLQIKENGVRISFSKSSFFRFAYFCLFTIDLSIVCLIYE